MKKNALELTHELCGSKKMVEKLQIHGMLFIITSVVIVLDKRKW